jgi:anti-sigma-K factor RskA
MTDRSLDILIDETVLGLADEGDMARLEALAARDPDIAARLEQARQRFAPLDDTVDALPLPEGLWGRVETQLDAPEEAGMPPLGAPDNVIEFKTLRGAINRWRRVALGGIAAAVLMACILGWSLMQSTQPLVVAVLLDTQGEAVALIEGGPDNTTRVTLLERPDVPSNQVMQVWTKPDAAGPPVSLGLLNTARSRVLSIKGLPAPHPEQLYEITLEPDGGSPTNLPTGPILGKGLAKAPVT